MIIVVLCYFIPVFGFAWFWVWISDVAPHCVDPPAYFYIDGLYMSIQVRGLRLGVWVVRPLFACVG